MLTSVICVTNRIGGLDVLCASLREQTDQGFELVLVDELRPYRRHLAPQLGAGTWHIAPGNATRWGSYMRSLNRGVELSRGDVLLFVSDYTCLSPTCIADHRAFHTGHDAKAVALAPISYTSLPPLHPDFPLEYGWAKIGHDPANYSAETYAPWLDKRRRHELYEEFRVAYERDLASGRLAPFMSSVFATPFAGWKDTEALKVWETNLRGPPSQFLNLKNDSCKASLIKELGGFDERADGTHGHQDSITHRHMVKVGATFHAVAKATVRNLDPHPIAIVRRAGLDDEANLKLAEALQ